jgi:hypothetical protein
MERRVVWVKVRMVEQRVQLVELMLAVIRTEAPTRLRQEKIESSKTFACGYRFEVHPPEMMMS